MASPTTPSKQGSSGASATSVNSASAAAAIAVVSGAEKTSSLRKTLDHRRQLVMQLFQDNGLFPSNQERHSVSHSDLAYLLLHFSLIVCVKVDFKKSSMKYSYLSINIPTLKFSQRTRNQRAGNNLLNI